MVTPRLHEKAPAKRDLRFPRRSQLEMPLRMESDRSESYDRASRIIGQERRLRRSGLRAKMRRPRHFSRIPTLRPSYDLIRFQSVLRTALA